MNRPPRRSGLTPEQERQRAEWARYAAEEQARRQAAAAARQRAAAARARREEAERRARRAEARRLFWNRFVLYLIMLGLIFAIGGGIFFFSLHRTERRSHPQEVTYLFGGEWTADGKTVTEPQAEMTLDYAEAVHAGVQYCSMTALADLVDLSITGTQETQKFSCPSGEYVRLTVGSASAEVNGDWLTMDGAVLLRGLGDAEALWVPLSFVRDWMQGVLVTLEADRVHLALDAAEPLGFLLKGSPTALAVDEKAEFGDTPAIPFKADLSAYEQYMNPADRDAYLTLINLDNKLDGTYIPSDLTRIADTRKDGRATQQMREYAARALEAFFIEMRACGVTDVSVTSAYRSFAYQTQLFDQRVAMYPSLPRAEAEAKAATVVAVPGSSEHQSGLCVDMHNLPSADIAFGNTEAFRWLSANAHKFGFILRYPADKTEITGISYEPWHYRYVGRYHATRIYESGLCLEEYVAQYRASAHN